VARAKQVEESKSDEAQGASSSSSGSGGEGSNALAELFGEATSMFESIPTRYQIIIGMAIAFVICNMDRVNISVAIIPMQQDYGWTPTQAGLIQSAFFYGYLLAQLPGGWLANKYGGERVLPFGVFLWSVATFAVPFLSGDTGALYLSRAAVGLGEGISPPAAVDVIARNVPVTERSRATTFVFGSMHVGTISGLLIAPALIKTLGWPSVFVVFGLLGVGWCWWFDDFISSKRSAAAGSGVEGAAKALEEPPAMAKKELAAEAASNASSASNASTSSDLSEGEGPPFSSLEEEKGRGDVPWGAIVKSTPIRALAYIHFCNNWAQYAILAWLPTFYSESLGVELHEAAQLSLLPAFCGILVSLVAAPLADSLVSGGMGVTRVRKIMQSVAFIAPSACMVACTASEDPQLATWLLPVGIGFQAFSLAGLYCNHQDLSPKYASVLSGATHLVASLPGVFGVPFTGWLLDHTGSWSVSLFAPCLFFYVSGIAVYAKYGSGDQQNFASLPEP